MKVWPDKYVIGLTGNIATGKSVVRRMLEHLGAYGVDADALSRRATAAGAPGYLPVIELFGKWIVAPDGQIDRSRLGRIVFSDSEALARLEAIIHPLVRQAVDLLVRRSNHHVIVVEAIKLLESPLRQGCDAIWVTYAPAEVQLARLMHKRRMSEEVARQRIAVQPPQEDKVSAANVVIRNTGSFEDTWKQVLSAWRKSIPAAERPASQVVRAMKDKLVVERAKPRQAAQIAELINRLSKKSIKLSSEDVMEAFGEKAFLLLKLNNDPVGVVGWQVENLVACTYDVYLDPRLSLSDAMRVVLEEVEKTSRELQCEVSLLFLPPHLARQADVWNPLGYEMRSVHNLGVRAWQEAAQESMPHGSVMLFKQLRIDRVLRPV